MEKVGPRGELFYIQPDFSIRNESENSALNSDSDNSFQLNSRKEKKLNPAEKLRKWMKKRKRKARKSFPLKPSKFDFNVNENILFDPFSIPSRDIVIDIDKPEFYLLSREALGRRISFSEELLGLELGVFEDIDSSYENGRIKVLGLISGKEMLDIKQGNSFFIRKEVFNTF